MPYGSGLSAQVGVKAETTVGTQVVVDRFYELLSESLAFSPTWLDGQGLRAGQAYQRVARTSQSRFTVGGDLTVEHADKGGMGLLWKHCLGSILTVPTQIGATTAWKQNHHAGATSVKTGLGLTVQVGRPQTDGTVKAHTYRGCKVVGWEFTVSDGALAQLKVTFDGWQEDLAAGLASASYTAGAGVFSFSDASVFKLGGTPTTAAGETTVAGGVSVATVVRSFTLRGSTPLATERYGLGNAGVKREQIENAIPEITGTLEGEYTSQSEIYALFKNNTTTALELVLEHGLAGTAEPYELGFVLPACKILEGGPQVGGPDIVGQSINFKAYDDGTTNPVAQVRLVSTDTTLA
jgi:hypothetical protein